MLRASRKHNSQASTHPTNPCVEQLMPAVPLGKVCQWSSFTHISVLLLRVSLWKSMVEQKSWLTLTEKCLAWFLSTFKDNHQWKACLSLFLQYFRFIWFPNLLTRHARLLVLQDQGHSASLKIGLNRVQWVWNYSVSASWCLCRHFGTAIEPCWVRPKFVRHSMTFPHMQLKSVCTVWV